MLAERDETENEYRFRLLFSRRIFESTPYQLTWNGERLMRVAMVKVLNLVRNWLLKHWDLLFSYSKYITLISLVLSNQLLQ